MRSNVSRLREVDEQGLAYLHLAPGRSGGHLDPDDLGRHLVSGRAGSPSASRTSSPRPTRYLAQLEAIAYRRLLDAGALE